MSYNVTIYQQSCHIMSYLPFVHQNSDILRVISPLTILKSTILFVYHELSPLWSLYQQYFHIMSYGVFSFSGKKFLNLAHLILYTIICHRLATDDSWSLILESPSSIVSRVSLESSTLTLVTSGVKLVSHGISCTYKIEKK